MEELEREIKKMMYEMLLVAETDDNILNFLPHSDDPFLQIRLPPGAPERNKPKSKRI